MKLCLLKLFNKSCKCTLIITIDDPVHFFNRISLHTYDTKNEKVYAGSEIWRLFCNRSSNNCTNGRKFSFCVVFFYAIFRVITAHSRDDSLHDNLQKFLDYLRNELAFFYKRIANWILAAFDSIERFDFVRWKFLIRILRDNETGEK